MTIHNIIRRDILELDLIGMEEPEGLCDVFKLMDTEFGGFARPGQLGARKAF